MVKSNGRHMPLSIAEQLKVANKERENAGRIIELLRGELEKAKANIARLQTDLHRTQISAAAAYWKAGITSLEQGTQAVNDYVAMLKERKAANQKLHDSSVVVIEDFLKKTDPKPPESSE